MRAFLTALTVSLAVLAPAGADQTFNTQAGFLAAAGAVTTETFEDEPLVGTPSSGAQLSLTFTDFKADSTPASLKILDVVAFGNQNVTPGGARYLAADTDQGNVSADLTWTWTNPITKLGFFFIDFENTNGSITVNGMNYPLPSNGNGGISYFGIIADVPFTQVFIDIGTTDSFSSFDDVAYGAGGGTPCPGDLNGDNMVNQSDLGIILAAYGTCPGQPGYNAQAGMLAGGPCVGQEDLGVLLANFGNVCQ